MTIRYLVVAMTLGPSNGLPKHWGPSASASGFTAKRQKAQQPDL